MAINMRRVLLLAALAIAVVLSAGCARGTLEREPEEPRTTDEHEFHTDQEHYDRGGAVEPKP